ncbi:histidine kinase [Rhodococcus sp. BP-252]|uniref:histidine kinase n=1 Tax=Rhodococcoides kyotonense TaxID=398843 RepID=A0A177YLX4_9NOCA|nr:MULTISPECIES: ATP-binding protein [Rhodococcus]MBY6414246.1 histidine kinase [Rhodococcus sp. BP-320]MBY6419016.1 histidine kinase [Rhodococcus sp. BP-321]MBY6423125.1 histidine kinase [Rhodococcus sp. BP-324]MBY6429050.1 histidine kinase [Rhodococcus sp. BP-323]MBY6434056.1 histidine kinase [Rhodococcus sp. BP-322]
MTAQCSPDELKTLFLFEHLTDDQLERLCQEGHVEIIEPGPVFAEGDPATCFYVLIEGSLVLSKLSGGEDLVINRTSQRGVYAGAWQAYLRDRVPQVYPGSMRVTERSRFFVLDADCFAEIVSEWFPMALHLLEGLFFGSRNTKQIVEQRERLLALGSLSAGLTHELNNPAAAAVRATSALRDRVAHMRQKLKMIANGSLDPGSLTSLVGLQEEAVELVAKAPKLSPLEASDREDELGDWFDDHDISGGWDIAPTFVQAGLDVAWLDKVVATVDDSQLLEGAIRWLNYTVETELLMNEIADSTTRVSTLVGAAKQYSQMDRAPYQTVDIRDLLDSTLVMLARKIGDDITVVKDYDASVPPIPAYAAELNQVWTNLIDNAVQAMAGEGTLTVRTRRDHDQVLVEVCDTGSGVPEDIQSRIFEPFFTTKPVGEGTGLGLDISWRIVVKKHRGDLSVQSVPGDTRFVVRLPIEPAAAPEEDR